MARDENNVIEVGDLVRNTGSNDTGIVLDILTYGYDEDDDPPIDVEVYWFNENECYWSSVGTVILIAKFKANSTK